MSRARVALAILALVLIALPARAMQHRRPFHPGIGLGYGYDNNYGGAGCTDYGCGGKCYDGHTGSDFPLGMGTDVLAGAQGTVTKAVQGCADWGYYGNPCGGQCGNHVKIRHDDGSYSLYCHLKNGSLTVGVGQYVGCGQKVGSSASSGSSTGPHLHFGWQPTTTSRDPFIGGCSGSAGGWVNQGGYNGTPGTDCVVTCDCSPGQQQWEGCGRCGGRHRECGGDCHWGGWSGCEGQGPCSPGAVETQACCDCGSQARSCQGNCQWGGYGACGGPDPAGAPPCDTGKLGDCAAGLIRCVGGCRTCTDTVFPTPELCDDHDSDCDGPIDEGATELGTPLPRIAASLVDASVPTGLAAGEVGTVWAVFENVGTERWPDAGIWLEAHGPDGEPSPFLDPNTWSAFDVVTHAVGGVEPGETTTLTFTVRMPTSYGGEETRFDLVELGAQIRCPSPGFGFAPTLLPPGAAPEPEGLVPPARADVSDAPAPSADASADGDVALPVEPPTDVGHTPDAAAGEDASERPASAEGGPDTQAEAAEDSPPVVVEAPSVTGGGCEATPGARGTGWVLVALGLAMVVRGSRRARQRGEDESRWSG